MANCPYNLCVSTTIFSRKARPMEEKVEKAIANKRASEQKVNLEQKK